MAKLIYSAIASLDGYTEDRAGTFDWAAPDDEVIGIDRKPALPRDVRLALELVTERRFAAASSSSTTACFIVSDVPPAHRPAGPIRASRSWVGCRNERGPFDAEV